MRLELVPSTSNVVRFPVERRVALSVELLFDIAPDVREVLNVAEAFGFTPPNPKLYDLADRAMAEILQGYDLPGTAVARRRIIDDLFQPLMDEATRAIDAAGTAGRVSEQAQQHLYKAAIAYGLQNSPLRDEAGQLAVQAAKALLVAHERVQWALGSWRAARLAHQGIEWTPRDPVAENDWLCNSQAAKG